MTKHPLPNTAPLCVLLSVGLGQCANYIIHGGWPNPLLMLTTAAITTFIVCFLLSRQETALLTRMARSTASEWRVSMNGVEVGTISDARYAQMQYAVFNDKHVVLAQMLNTGHAAFNMIKRLAWTIPMAMFWLAVVVLVVDRDAFVQTVELLRGADATTLANAFQTVLWTMGVLGSVALGIATLLGDTFGFRNCSEQALSEKLRVHCGAVTSGDLAVEMEMAVAPSSVVSGN